MERIYQMKVVPDILPDLRPTLDLHVTARTLPKEFHDTGKVSKEVEPGTFLTPGQVRFRAVTSPRVHLLTFSQTLKQPKLYPTVFHPETRLYTMLLVDPGTFRRHIVLSV